MRLLVTRPRPQAQAWVERLREEGWDAAALPLLGIDEAPDTRAVAEAWSRLPDFALAVFVSPNAVQRFFDWRPAGAAWPSQVMAGSPGPGTSAALRACGVPAASLVAPAEGAAQFDSESLWAQLGPRRDWRGARVLIVRGEGGRDWLANTLSQAGAGVEFLQAYRRGAPDWSEAERGLLSEALERPPAHLWLLSSSEAVDRLQSLAPGVDWSSSRAVATHPRIAQRARDAGFGRVDELPPGVDPLLQALRERRL